MVVGKDYEPRLDVQVKGVPGYIYYNRDYKLTVEYTNHGGAIDGPVEVSVVLPETFALAERIDDPRRHGETLTWTVDGLGSGEAGSIVISVRGTLPDDLTNAVYDLPGYAGHTAFVEGFQLKAAIRAGSSFADTVAIADTGAAQFNSFIRIIKDTQPNSPTLFGFTDNSQICDVPDLEDDGVGNGNDFTCPPIPPGAYVITEDDPAPLGYELTNIVCTTTETAIDTTTVDIPNRTANIDLDPNETVTCTFTNEPTDTGTITIIKDTVPNSGTNFAFTENIPGCTVGPLEDDGVGMGNIVTCDDVPVGLYTVTEDDPGPLGYALIGLVCTSEFPNAAAPASSAGGGKLVSFQPLSFTTNLLTRTASIDLEPFEEVTCTFTNSPVSTPTPTPTRTTTVTPTLTPTATETATATATLTFTPAPDPRGGLGGLFAPKAPTTVAPTRQPAAPVVSGIRPPSTGDAGLSSP
nr:H139 [uncultured bacterium]